MKVSILIPIYNSGKYLRECLDSVLAQTHCELQVVLVNDGSSDDSWDICSEYAARDPRVEAYTQANAGVATTRNRLLDKIKGNAFLFVDSDDVIHPRMVETLAGLLAEDDIDVAMCENVTFDDGTPLPEAQVAELQPQVWSQEETVLKFLFHSELTGSLWSKLIKTSLLRKARFDASVSYGEDALFFWQLLPGIRRTAHTPAPFYYYRMNPASISHTHINAGKFSGGKVWRTIVGECTERFPRFATIARGQLSHQATMLLFEAARSGISRNEVTDTLRTYIKENLRYARIHRIGDRRKRLFAALAVLSWPIARLAIKLTR